MAPSVDKRADVAPSRGRKQGVFALRATRGPAAGVVGVCAAFVYAGAVSGSARVLGVAFICVAACREPPRPLALRAEARTRVVEGKGATKDAERVDVEVHTEAGATVRVGPKPHVATADASGNVKVTLDLPDLRGRPVEVTVSAADNASRTARLEVAVERAPGMRREGRGWAVLPTGCRWELDRFKLVAHACEPGTAFELAGKRVRADGPDLDIALDADAVIAKLPASLERISSDRKLDVVVTTPTGKRYDGWWDMGAFEAEARARLRAAEATAAVFGKEDVAAPTLRAAYFFARGSNTPRLVGKASTVSEVDLVAFEREGGVRASSCPTATGGRPVQLKDSRVEVFDRRRGARVHDKLFRATPACTASDDAAFVSDATMRAWLETLLK